ncbi:hypothetical protein GCM10027592_07350 [Spirosoma flavus]
MKKLLTSLFVLFALTAFGQKVSPIPGSKDPTPEVENDVQVISLPNNLVSALPSKPTSLLAGSMLFQQENLYSNNNSAATATALGGTAVKIRGNLYPKGDIDYYSFTANAGDRVYAATMTAFAYTGSGSSQDSQLTLIGPDGSTVIEFDDDNGSFSALSSSIAGAIIPTTGTYYIKVNDFTAGTTLECPYDLYLKVQSGSPTPEVEGNDTPATANTAPASGWVSGARNTAAATEQDWYSITLNAGETVFLSLDLDPERDGTSWNGRLGFALFGDAGNQIMVTDDAGTSDATPNPTIPSEAMFFTVKESGTYYLFVDAASAAVGGPTATYHLSVSKLDATTGFTTYTSTDVPKAIGPSNGSVSSTVTIPGNAIIKDLAVRITLNHALMQDVDAILTTPEGNQIGLFTDIGSAATGGQTQMDIRLNDYNALPPSFTVLKPVNLMPKRESKLNQLKGMKAGGTWTLTLYDDNNNASGGTLTSWGIEILADDTPATLATYTPIYSQDFESGDGGFTHSGTNDQWERGTPNTAATTTATPIAAFTTANSGTNAWKTNLTGPYALNSNQLLESGDIDLTAVTGNSLILSWAMKHQMEGTIFDQLEVYVEEVGGGGLTQNVYTWIGGDQRSGTSGFIVGNPTVNVPMSTGWGTFFADVSAFKGKTIRFKVRLTSDNSVFFGGVAIDDVKLYVNCTTPATPVLAAGNQTTVCSGTPASLSATCSVGTVKWYDAAGTTLLSSGSPYNTPNLTANTIYQVRCENADCVSAFVSTTVTVTPATVGGNVAGSTSVCAGTNSTTLTLSGNVGAVQRWEASATSSFASTTAINTTSNSLTVLNVTQTTYFRAVVKNGSCSEAFSGTAVITANPAVTATISGATSVCSGGTTTLTASGGNSYQWSNNATTASITAVAGVYSVTVTNTSTGCSGTASVTVTSGSAPTPTLTASPSATLTCAQTSLTLTASGGTSYTFTGPNVVSQSGNTAIVNVAGTYSVTVANASGCTSSTTTTIFSATSVPTVSISPSNATLTCATQSVSLSATGSAGTYLWSTGATSQVISATVGGPYSVTLTDGNGCTAMASTTVTQATTPPTVSINPPSATLTCANSVVSLTAVGTGTYLWNTGATSQVISATAGGIYSVTSTNNNGCTAMASATVVQDNTIPTVNISPASATLTCTTTSVSLSATGSTGTYRWSTGATSQVISATSANTYSVTLTASNGCTAIASAQVVQDNSVPTVSISPNSATLNCTTSSVSLSATGTGTYRWNTGAVTQVISATAAGTYTVTLTAGNGCTATTSATVAQSSSALSVSISANPSLTIGAGQSTTLTASGATNYQWSTSANTASIVVNTPGVYSVTGTTGTCSGVASVTVLQAAPAGPFAISAVTTNNCQQIASNRYVISFTPVYSGTNAQPISFSVVNELFPTTEPGPYTLQLYTDNPVIVLKAIQTGTPGEASFSYNWLAACSNPMPNTPPRVNQPLVNQIAQVGQAFGYTIPQNTFTDNETPQSLVLSVSGLPAGLNFTQPNQIGGVPSVTGVSSVSVTATDPQGLSVSTSFSLSVVMPTGMNTPPTVANPVANQTIIQGQPFSLNVSNVFTDAQTPTSLALTSSPLPAGLTLTNGVISGTPSAAGTTSVTLTATDPGSLSASYGFTISVQSATVSGGFAITGVTTDNCQQIAANRYAISFTPRYSGTNAQPISFSVVNELAPTTAAGPYNLQLYTDNPVIVLKAIQTGTPGEVSFSYNWLAACSNPMPNTPPRVNQPLTNQTAQVGTGFGYTIPQLTFTDNETPNSLVLSVSGLPAGLSFSPPSQIGGVPSVTGVSSVTVTATDPQGLSVSTTFTLTVNPAGGFIISGVQTVSCVVLNANQRSLTFTPIYGGSDGSPISFSVVNEMLPTTAPGPYQLTLYTDNPVLQLRARQGSLQASYAYNWLAACGSTRQGVTEVGSELQVTVLGNPTSGQSAAIEIRGAYGQRVSIDLVDMQGRSTHQQVIDEAGTVERVRVPLAANRGILLLQVRTASQLKTVKLIKSE